MSKTLDISNVTPGVALHPRPFTTVRESAIDREDLKPYWKSEKRPHISWG